MVNFRSPNFDRLRLTRPAHAVFKEGYSLKVAISRYWLV